MKIRLNSDSTVVEAIKSSLESNGGYCPCRIKKTEDSKCICKEFRDFIKAGHSGFCHCGLYESYDER